MKFVGLLLRLFSYLYFLLTSLLLLGIALVATLSHQPLHLRMLPFEEGHLLWGTYAVGLGGLIAVFLAVARKWRYFFPVWAATTLYSLVNGYFISSYKFQGRDDFREALWFVFAALVAFVGALWTLKPRRGRLYS